MARVNPFATPATEGAVASRDAGLTAQRDALDASNYELGGEISLMLSDKFDEALADDTRSLPEQIAAAQKLNNDLKEVVARLNGTTASPLTTEEQRLVDDYRKGAIKLETEEVTLPDGATEDISAWSDSRVRLIIAARRAKSQPKPAPTEPSKPAAPAPAPKPTEPSKPAPTWRSTLDNFFKERL